MLRERVAADIYVFRSEMYLQVTAGVIVTEEGAVVVDTLPFPQETARLRDFALRRCPQGIRYVITTHAHADHSHGNYLFTGAQIISHRRAREFLAKYGEQSLLQAKNQTPELSSVQLRLPEITFDNMLILRLGGKTITLRHSPGHSPDVITVRVREDKVLFASDTMLPVPHIDFPGGGNIDDLRRSLRNIEISGLENVVQGHGEVLLRGEIRGTIIASLKYLDCVEHTVDQHIRSGAPVETLLHTPIEQCGRSRIPLNGMVQKLHQANLYYLYQLKTGHAVARHP
ncbi:MAG: MBL fold metallo-hydrolase [Caldilineales bacterium]